MAVFAVTPTELGNTCKKISNYLGELGEANSVASLAKKVNEQMEELVQPGVWAGDAAYANFQDFMSAHTALVNFVNNFGNLFSDLMTKVAREVGNLETTNLGVNNTIVSSFGTLTYQNVQDLSIQNIKNGNVALYDYNRILGISERIKNIVNQLLVTKDSIKTEINKFDSGNQIWDGVAASAARGELNNSVEKNFALANEALNKCVANMTSAAQNAQNVDRA